MSILALLTRLLLFSLIGVTTLIIGYPTCKLMRLKATLIEALVVGSWTIILLVFVMGLLRISFDTYVLPTFLFFLLTFILVLEKFKADFHHAKIDQQAYFIVLLSLLAILTRILQINPLLVPNWLDGIRHYGITFNILERGFVLPDRIYHTGFHSLAAYLTILMPIFSLSEILLVLGQWFSFLAGLSLLLLIQRSATESSWALTSSTLLWFFAIFPSYLTSWARYPLMAGIAFLPLACLTVNDCLKDRIKNRQFIVVLFSGAVLFLTHYFVFFIWLCYLLLTLVSEKKRVSIKWGYWASFCIVLFALIVTRLPAFLSLLQNLRVDEVSDILDLEEVFYTLGLMLKGSGWIVWLLAAIGIYKLPGTQRPIFWWVAITFSLGVLFELFQNLISETRPNGIQNSLILFTLPLVYFAACGVNYVWQLLQNRGFLAPHLRFSLAGVTFLVITVSMYNNAFHIINPDTILFEEADLGAMQWIIHNTSRYDTIAVASSLWGDQVRVCDGGAWTQYLTERPIIEIDEAFETDYSNASYIYLGSCQDPISYQQYATHGHSIVYKDEGVEIIRIAH